METNINTITENLLHKANTMLAYAKEKRESLDHSSHALIDELEKKTIELNKIPKKLEELEVKGELISEEMKKGVEAIQEDLLQSYHSVKNALKL